MYILHYASLLIFWPKPKRSISFSLPPSSIPVFLPLIWHVLVEYHLLARHCSRFWGWSSERSRKLLLNKMGIGGPYGEVVFRLRNLYIAFDTDGHRSRFFAVPNSKLYWPCTQLCVFLKCLHQPVVEECRVLFPSLCYFFNFIIISLDFWHSSSFQLIS